MSKMYQAHTEIVFGGEEDGEKMTCGHWHANVVDAIKCLREHGWVASMESYSITVRIDEPSCCMEDQEYVDCPITLDSALSVAAHEQQIGEDIVIDSDDESDLACAQIEAIENFKRVLLEA